LFFFTAAEENRLRAEQSGSMEKPITEFAASCGSARLTAGVFLLGAALGGCASLVPQTISLRDAWPRACRSS